MCRIYPVNKRREFPKAKLDKYSDQRASNNKWKLGIFSMYIILKLYNSKEIKTHTHIFLRGRLRLNEDPVTNKTASSILTSNFSSIMLDARSQYKMFQVFRRKCMCEGNFILNRLSTVKANKELFWQ